LVATCDLRKFEPEPSHTTRGLKPGLCARETPLTVCSVPSAAVNLYNRRPFEEEGGGLVFDG